MQTYTAPLRDMRFVLNELHEGDGFGNLSAFAEITPDLADAVLTEAARICDGVIAPLNRSGDEEGCHFEDGVVRTPAGFKAAWDQFVAAGWNALVLPTQWGGQGLPEALGKLVDEMVCAANVSFSQAYRGSPVSNCTCAMNSVSPNCASAPSDKVRLTAALNLYRPM